MAGAGKKTFIPGEILTASDVNSYLMDQAVMRFADASARSASLTSPSEGMVTYLDDLEQVEVYNGTEWLPVGVGVYADDTARDAAISTPDAGTFVYLTGDNELQVYNGSASAWEPVDTLTKVGDGSTGFILTWGSSGSPEWTEQTSAGDIGMVTASANIGSMITRTFSVSDYIITAPAPTVGNVYFLDSVAGSLVASAALVSGVANVTLPASADTFTAATTTAPVSFLISSVTPVGASVGSVTVYDSPGVYTGNGPAYVGILGGGGGGAGGNAPAGVAGGGGGSGYLNSAFYPSLPGSVSYAIGAGGASLSSGGATTFGSASAAGGNAASGQGGAAGGSGGAQGRNFSPVPAAVGGTNGADGTRAPGTGSGYAERVFPVGTGGPQANPGGVYGGGGGGSYIASNNNTVAPTAIHSPDAPASAYGGGGAGGSTFRFGGTPAVAGNAGAGGPGAVIVVEFS